MLFYFVDVGILALNYIYVLLRPTTVSDARLSVVGVAGWPLILTG